MKTVKDLIEELQQLPQDLVVITTGEHGNYTPFDGVEEGNLRYEAESTWSGEIHDLDEWNEENDPEEDPCPGVACCILRGVN